jgi:exodeoxyribonuclease V beta subunit
MSNVLDLATQSLDDGFLVEASAGTGKTYSVAALVTRLIATSESTRIGSILITTFTRNAAAELRDRIRRRLVETANALSATPSPDVPDDEIVAHLRKGTAADVAASIMRLRRAAVEFDTATIATIHSVLSKILVLAGRPMVPSDDDSQATRVIDEVVNDLLLNAAMKGESWDEKRIRALVVAKLGEPLTDLWFDPSLYDAGVVRQLERAAEIVRDAVAEIERRGSDHPSFNDLMRRAHAVVTDPTNHALVAEFQQRFTLAMVDESQDTDAIQWELFNALFPAGGRGALVAVGDPKQSIYKFRGADIDSYAAQKKVMPVVTLTTNFRTDQPLIDDLNVLFDGFTFGSSVSYTAVTASADHAKSRISGVKPFETVRFGGANNGIALARSTARRVLYLLATAKVDGRPVAPTDVVVLARSGANGRLIERELRRWGVPAVSSGTASVMDSEMAGHIRVLLEAMERVSSVGRARRMAATRFIDSSILDPRLMDDDFVTSVQDIVYRWSSVLRREGVAGLASVILNDVEAVGRITAGSTGQRHLTDFSHVMELLHRQTEGAGATPEALLRAFDELSEADKTSDLVARRVESDLNAVQIMTMHVSKGLEFPVVVVADTWKKPKEDGNKPKIVRIDDNGVSRRIIDMTHALKDVKAPAVSAANLEAEAEESRRLFYVAVTRAKHHVSLMLNPGDQKNLPVAISTPQGDAVTTAIGSLPVVDSDSLPAASPYAGASAAGVGVNMEVEPANLHVRQTYRRTSFTGITEVREGLGIVVTNPTGAGADESTAASHSFPQYAGPEVPEGADMPLARVPGGTHLGKVMHKVYELVDFTAQDLEAEIRRVVNEVVTAQVLRGHRRAIERAVLATLVTPLGGELLGRTLADFGNENRLAEMDFEMGLPSLLRGAKVNHLGRVLADMLPADDVLAPYARALAGASFDIPLAGLINGSIDALLRLDTTSGPRLFVTDYKTNRLDSVTDTSLIDAYAPNRLVRAMEHHHYPLQALIYGTAVHRWVKWRAPHLDAEKSVAGMTYFFVRGMTGASNPVDEQENPYGVFSWTAPAGLWGALSDAMNGGAQ